MGIPLAMLLRPFEAACALPTNSLRRRSPILSGTIVDLPEADVKRYMGTVVDLVEPVSEHREWLTCSGQRPQTAMIFNFAQLTFS